MTARYLRIEWSVSGVSLKCVREKKVTREMDETQSAKGWFLDLGGVCYRVSLPMESGLLSLLNIWENQVTKRKKHILAGSCMVTRSQGFWTVARHSARYFVVEARGRGECLANGGCGGGGGGGEMDFKGIPQWLCLYLPIVWLAGNAYFSIWTFQGHLGSNYNTSSFYFCACFMAVLMTQMQRIHTWS